MSEKTLNPLFVIHEEEFTFISGFIFLFFFFEARTAKTAAEEAAKSQARQQVSAALTQVLPDEVNRVRLYGLRGLPIIGDIIRRAEQIDSLRWMFGFRKKDEE